VTLSHLQALVLFAALTATVLAVVQRPRGRRRRFGLAVFGAFVLGAIALSWLMAGLGP
jgi:hypothetical protein